MYMKTEREFIFGEQSFLLDRYPPTTQKSLQAWSSADELLIEFAKSRIGNVAIYGDVFGALAVSINTADPVLIINAQSQKKSIDANLRRNFGEDISDRTAFPMGKLPCFFHSILIRVPKSLGMFELYLQQASVHLGCGGQIACGFMTKYFTPRLLTIASKYFNVVEQSRAEKKARLLFLSAPKELVSHEPLIKTISTDWGLQLRQYYGVFSADHIDNASLFLIDHLHVSPSEHAVLDMASGNGVLSCAVLHSNPSAQMYLVDDLWLAVESSKFNVPGAVFVWDDTLDQFETSMFDLIVSNPPFHFGYETNIEVSLRLFTQAARCLKRSGRFLMVANKHLNYEIHLSKIFMEVKVIAENDKYIIYESSH